MPLFIIFSVVDEIQGRNKKLESKVSTDISTKKNEGCDVIDGEECYYDLEIRQKNVDSVNDDVVGIKYSEVDL